MNLFASFRTFLIATTGILLAVFATTDVTAQNSYGNEWINFNQSYYKIQVVKDGIYRISAGFLDSAGIKNVDPRNFQLFRRGQEVAIHVEGQNDGQMNSQDYIEFYGQRNDGKLDAELYKNPANQVNPDYSIYTDSAAYFLTWSGTPGKRMAVTQTPATGNAQPYFLQVRENMQVGNYSRGKMYGENHLPWIDAGEGFFSSSTKSTNVIVDEINNVYTSGPNPKVTVKVVGASETRHDVEVSVEQPSGGNRLLGKLTFNGYNFVDSTFSINFSDIKSNGTVKILFVTKNTSGAVGDNIRVSTVKVTFPQTAAQNASNFSFYSDPTLTGSLYNISGLPNSSAGYLVSNPFQVSKIISSTATNGVLLQIPTSSGVSEKIMTTDAAKPARIKKIEKTVFRQIDPTQPNYIIISNKVLQKAVGSISNPVKEYSNYRASASGGGYDTLTVFIDQLYNQFHYGESSPNAIMRFMNFMIDKGSPQHLLLLGKGYEPDVATSGRYYRNEPNRFTIKDLVPSSGAPGSDVLFTANWKNNSFSPRVAVGRVSSKTSIEVIDYLNKVKEHEALSEYEPWRKNFLHLSGGNSVQEMNLLKSYINSYERKAEGPFVGANVNSKYKTSTVDFIKQVNVADEINAGLSMVTFFGHSSTSTSDLDIGSVSNQAYGYNNKGKYPMILMNGCFAGGCFTPAMSFGEDWVITPNKGSILYLAHVNYGYPNLLNEFSNNFYTYAFTDSSYYGKPVGIIHQKTIEELNNVQASDLKIALALEMLLQGDPAVKLVSPDKPDYAINNNSLSIKSLTGKPVSMATDSIVITINLQNLGKTVVDPVTVALTINGGTLKTEQFYNYSSNDTLLFKLSDLSALAPGVNSFKVEVDYGNLINERDETNNIGEFTYYISSSGIATLFPLEYSIINSSSTKLVAQATAFQTTKRDFYFEVDTTAKFNSLNNKSLLNGTVNSEYLAELPIQLPSQIIQKDSVVFYWRTRFKDVQKDEDTIWATSSFRYIRNSQKGWSQSHYQQLEKASLNKLTLNTTVPKKLDFDQIFSQVDLRVPGGAISSKFNIPYGIYLNGVLSKWQYSLDCHYNKPTMYLLVLNSKTLERYTDMPVGKFCNAKVYSFNDLSNISNQQKLEQFITAIPNDFYVIGISVNSTPFSTFAPSLKAAFNSIGSSLIDNLETGYPFAIIGQKGATPGSAMERTYDSNVSTPPTQQAIHLFASLSGNTSNGTITSTKIGPASQWSTLYHTVKVTGSDRYKLDVIGYDLQGNDSVIFKDVKNPAMSLASVDANRFPYLQLRMELEDTLNRTVPDLKQWMITYQGVPEGLMRPDFVDASTMYDLSNKALSSEVKVDFAYHNISDLDFTDSLTAEISLLKDNTTPVVENVKLKPLIKNDTVWFSHQFSTLGMSGDYRMRVYVNPRLLPEEYYFNNILEVPFSVQGKDLHPILDVVFDGQHIMDGDLVSPRPIISVSLKDEKNLRYLEDGRDMQFLMKGPNDADYQVVDVMNNPAEIRVTKADEKTDFKIEYQPKEALPDGTYSLQIQGRDVSGNKSGVEPYRISFEVENKSTISHFYPYPNPFSSNTRFIFTLSGSVMPTDLKVQIMTVTGKIIREITKDELFPTGGMRIGNNTSEYAWDGRDEFGDKLANGVYLYRVVMDTGDTEFQHRRTSADKAFKKDYGKIYILR